MRKSDVWMKLYSHEGDRGKRERGMKMKRGERRRRDKREEERGRERKREEERGRERRREEQRGTERKREEERGGGREECGSSKGTGAFSSIS